MFVKLAIVLGLSVGIAVGFELAGTISPSNGVAKGAYGNVELCDDLTFPKLFELKSDGATSLIKSDGKTFDNCGVTALRFTCTGGVKVISSLEGSEGTYRGTHGCLSQDVTVDFVGIQINVNPNSGSLSDKIAIEDIRMVCSDSTATSGMTGEVVVLSKKELRRDDQSLYWEEVEEYHPRRTILKKKVPLAKPSSNDFNWGPVALCPTDSRVIGLQTRVDETDAFDDNEGLTDVVLFCGK